MENIAYTYREFFDFMKQEHGLTLNIEQMNKILSEARILDQKLNEYEFFDEVSERWYAHE